MKPLICAFLLGSSLLVAYAPRAEAHGPGYAIVVHEGKVPRKLRPDLPRWLEVHYGFHRWYAYNHRYHARHPNWQRLYRLYLKDAAWHRRAHRHHGNGRGHAHRHGRGCRHR